MAVKGDRAATEPLAMRLYVDGHGLAEISRQLDVSDTTLRRWKSESGVPGEEVDGWDKARQQKRGVAQRLQELFDRELAAAEDKAKGTVSSPEMDALQKIGTLALRYADIERSAGKSIDLDRPKIFLENIEWLASQLRDMDPEGLKVLARNFDELIMRFKAEHAKTS